MNQDYARAAKKVVKEGYTGLKLYPLARPDIGPHGTIKHAAWRRVALDIMESTLRVLDARRIIRGLLRLEGDILRLGNRAWDLRTKRRVFVVGAGQAGNAMAQGVEELLGERTTQGLVIVKRREPGDNLTRIELVTGGHPLPNQDGLAASRRLLEMAHRAAPDALFMLEDPLHEDDFEGFAEITRRIPAIIAGDDLFVTNLERVKRGVALGAANAMILRPNQVGTISEALAAARFARENGYHVIGSGRAGRTIDDPITDIAPAAGARLVKFGAPRTGERLAKHNYMLRLEQELGSEARFAGPEVFVLPVPHAKDNEWPDHARKAGPHPLRRSELPVYRGRDETRGAKTKALSDTHAYGYGRQPERRVNIALDSTMKRTLILPAGTNGAPKPAPATHVAFLFTTLVPVKQWRLTSEGDSGENRLEGKKLTLDFSKGARWVGIGFPERSLPGIIDRVRVKARGEAKGQSVDIFPLTHVTIFHKRLGQLSGGEQELASDGPPGPGWECSGWQIDGKLHGPLRLSGLRFEAPGAGGKANLEVLGIELEAHCSAERQVLVTARLEETDGAASFACDLRACSEEPIEGVLRCLFRTWDGAVLERNRHPLVLEPRLALQAVSVPCPARPPGCRFVEAEFQFEAAAQQVAPAQAYWVSAVPPAEGAKLQPESPFGMDVYLERHSTDTMEQVARKARDAGVKWSREDFSWTRIEPRRGEFHWDHYDRLLDCARSNGITVLGMIGYWTGWTKPYTAEGVEDYVRFTRAVAAHYKDRVHHWEIWNEPNIFFWAGPKEMYAELLTKSYHALKEVDPHAQVLGLSTSQMDFKFIEQMLASQAAFDVPTKAPPAALLEGDNDWPAIMKAVDEIGYTGWAITEQPGGDSPEGLNDLAERLARIVAI